MFGAEATKSLTKIDKGFLNTRGQWFDIDNIGMSSVISCISMFHPRYILAHPKSKKESWIDLKSVREKLSWLMIYFFIKYKAVLYTLWKTVKIFGIFYAYTY